MDSSNPAATSAEEFPGASADWRTDLYTARALPLTFAESIALNQALGVKHAPELKEARHKERVDAIFGGQQQY